MGKVIRAVDTIISWICIILLILMVLAAISSVLLRYFFNISFKQMEEGIIMLFCSFTYIGFALGIRESGHISIPFIHDKAKHNVKPFTLKILDVFIMMVIIGVTIVIFKQSVLWIGRVGNVISVPLQIPYKYFYSVMPLSLLLAIYYALLNILSVFFKIPLPHKGFLSDEELLSSNCEEENSLV